MQMALSYDRLNPFRMESLERAKLFINSIKRKEGFHFLNEVYHYMIQIFKQEKIKYYLLNVFREMSQKLYETTKKIISKCYSRSSSLQQNQVIGKLSTNVKNYKNLKSSRVF